MQLLDDASLPDGRRWPSVAKSELYYISGKKKYKRYRKIHIYGAFILPTFRAQARWSPYSTVKYSTKTEQRKVLINSIEIKHGCSFIERQSSYVSLSAMKQKGCLHKIIYQ